MPGHSPLCSSSSTSMLLLSLGMGGSCFCRATAACGLAFALALANCPSIIAEAEDVRSKACSCWKAAAAFDLSPACNDQPNICSLALRGHRVEQQPTHDM